MTTFTIDAFVADCRAALDEGPQAPAAVREILQRTVSRPDVLRRTLGDPAVGPTTTVWHHAPDLTILHLIWPPGADLRPHDHRMWAAIGLYNGREDNHFYRSAPGGLEEAGGRSLLEREVVGLGRDAIHRVVNPTVQWTGAIHVYGGDFFTTPRTSWSLESGEAEPFDADRVAAYLETTAAAVRSQTA